MQAKVNSKLKQMFGNRVDGVLVTITGKFKRHHELWYQALTPSGWKIIGPASAFTLMPAPDAAAINPVDLSPELVGGIANLKRRWAK